jgi:hypothetical protein
MTGRWITGSSPAPCHRLRGCREIAGASHALSLSQPETVTATILEAATVS